MKYASNKMERFSALVSKYSVASPFFFFSSLLSTLFSEPFSSNPSRLAYLHVHMHMYVLCLALHTHCYAYIV